MTVTEFAALVKSELPYEPNSQQDALIGALARFCAGLRPTGENSYNQPDADKAFVVNGYAGTGKTSLVSALVRALESLKIKVVLMAPTGRAAKVFSAYSGHSASTIHRKIYRHSLHGEVPGLKENKDSDTLYIVDEASMIASDKSGSGSDILTNLLTYVYGGCNNRLILMGDTAQLPPVGEIDSPAMNVDYLRELGLKVSSATLTRVVRQGARSGILANAVNIRRDMVNHPTRIPKPIVEPFKDVDTITATDLDEAIDSAYRTEGIQDTIIITRSNRRASEFNKAIRNLVLYYEEVLEVGEPILIVKNNYFWTRVSKRHDIDFIANGDILRVTRIIDIETKYGFTFANIEVAPAETNESENETQPLQVKIFIETLASEHPTLPAERLHLLYERIVRSEYADNPDPLRALSENPYWNALQAKYAYCVTCHKAQGGQWSRVFVDIAYINPDTIGKDLYRWMYTATTRARHHLTYITDNTCE